MISLLLLFGLLAFILPLWSLFYWTKRELAVFTSKAAKLDAPLRPPAAQNLAGKVTWTIQLH